MAQKKIALKLIGVALAGCILFFGSQDAFCRTIQANPSNYQQLIQDLQPGDTLVLEPGQYDDRGLRVEGLHGTPTEPIVITGPELAESESCQAVDCPEILGYSGWYTVHIEDTSHVQLRNLEINCRNRGFGAIHVFGVTHHMTFENLYIHAYDGDQGYVGIAASRGVSWNWVIRRNIITDGGTGMYLGNSDGENQFIGALIEHNLIYDTLGYNMQIKHQNPRPMIEGMPSGQSKTIIRYNVFSKGNNASSGSRARPNLLLGHFPLSGPGQEDVYEVYGNYLQENPYEALVQAEGNVAFYDNLLFNSRNSSQPAINIRPHNDKPRKIRVFNNTVVSRNRGIRVSGGYGSFEQKVFGNAVFSADPIDASDQEANVTGTYEAASSFLVAPFAELGEKDLYPKPDKLKGPALASGLFGSFTDELLDFNRTLRDSLIFRGAYHGEGTNPGWLPKLERRPSFGAGNNEPPEAPTGLTLR